MGYELYRRKRSGPWSVYFLTREGDRFRRSTKQTDKRLATAVADEWYRRRADPTYQAANETSVQQAVRGLMQALEDAGKRPATRRFYAEKCGHIARLFGPDLPLARIDAKLVDSYIRDRKREGAARYTISKELTALRQMLKHARRRGEFDKELSQVMPIGFATGYKPRERRLTMAQAWALIGDLPEGPARYVAYVCAVTARDAAVPRARGKHLTAVGVLVLDGKTSRSTRLVPVPQLLYPFLFRAFWGVSDEAMVAPGVSSVRHAMDRACARLKLPHVSPNDLRRSVAHWLLEAGVPRDVAAAYMGHANTKMLDMVYGKLDPKELGAALARALPPPSDDVDLVWTTPADPGDEGDSGHGASSGNTCAGGDLNTGHADFQSSSETGDSPVVDAGSAQIVDEVWNPASVGERKLRDAADGAGNGAQALDVTQCPFRTSDNWTQCMLVAGHDGSHAFFERGQWHRGTGWHTDPTYHPDVYCRLCPTRSWVEGSDPRGWGWREDDDGWVCPNHVTGEEKDDGTERDQEGRRVALSPDDRAARLHPRPGDGGAVGVLQRRSDLQSDRPGRRGNLSTIGQSSEHPLAPAASPARQCPYERPVDSYGPEMRCGLPDGHQAPHSFWWYGSWRSGSGWHIPAASPAREGEETSEVVMNSAPIVREDGRTPPAEAPKSRHSSHWLGPAGVFVDGLLGVRR